MNETWREKAQILNEFALKVLAMALMCLDHIGLFLLSYQPGNMVGLFFRGAGRLAFPLFAFMLAEGMRKTRNEMKYLLRLGLMWALVTLAQAVLYYAFSFKDIQSSSNAFADLLLGGLFLYCACCLEGPKKFFSILPAACVLASYGLQVAYWNGALPTSFPLFFLPGYSLYGFALIVGFYFAKDLVSGISKKYLADSGVSTELFQESKKCQGLINMVCACVLFIVTLIGWGLSYIPSIALDVVVMQATDLTTQVGQTWCLLAIVPLLCYDGRRGPDGKFFRVFSYAFYPMHLAVIFAIFYLIFEL